MLANRTFPISTLDHPFFARAAMMPRTGEVYHFEAGLTTGFGVRTRESGPSPAIVAWRRSSSRCVLLGPAAPTRPTPAVDLNNKPLPGWAAPITGESGAGGRQRGDRGNTVRRGALSRTGTNVRPGSRSSTELGESGDPHPSGARTRWRRRGAIDTGRARRVAADDGEEDDAPTRSNVGPQLAAALCWGDGPYCRHTPPETVLRRGVSAPAAAAIVLAATRPD